MSFFTEELQELFPPVDPFFAFGDPASPDNSLDIFASVGGFQNDVEETDMCSALFVNGSGSGFRYSSSPPCQQLENLTLFRSNWSYPTEARRENECLESVKRERLEPRQGFDEEAFVSRSYDGGCYGFNKYTMQRNSFIDETRGIGNVHELPHGGWMDSPQNGFFGGQIRRASSTGDLQFSRNMRARGPSPRAFSSPLVGDASLNAGEQNAKAVRCSAEEKKDKILKYRAKRAQRNFNKTIKYVCRKTLADTRPRIRGRFARNDEVGDTPKAGFVPNNNDEEDGFWVGLGLHEGQDQEFHGAVFLHEGGEETRGRCHYNN